MILLYTVKFEQHHTYKVEANNEDEAFDKAHKEFVSDMRYPVANTFYDFYDIECDEGDEED